MHSLIKCVHRVEGKQEPTCKVVSLFSHLPIEVSYTNDSACRFCLECGVPPQTPNLAVASMAIGAAIRSKDSKVIQETSQRVEGHLTQLTPERLSFWDRCRGFVITSLHTLWRMVRGKRVFVTEDIITTRLAVCKQCEKFSNNQCTLCGCGCNAKMKFKNKLAHVSSQCPLTPPKWGPV